MKNPRIQAREMLARIKRQTGSTIAWLELPSRYKYADTPGGEKTWHHTPRKFADIPPEDLPENDPETWKNVAGWARSIAREAYELEVFAREQEIAAARKGHVVR